MKLVESINKLQAEVMGDYVRYISSLEIDITTMTIPQYLELTRNLNEKFDQIVDDIIKKYDLKEDVYFGNEFLLNIKLYLKMVTFDDRIDINNRLGENIRF